MIQQIVFLVTISGAFNAQIPSSFEKCDRKQADFQQCLTKAIENALHHLDKPLPQYGVPSFNPLEIPQLSIPAGNGPTGFKQDFTNMKLKGFTVATCLKSELNFDKKTLKLLCNTPELEIKFNYAIDGKILVLPIFGKGPGTIRLMNLDMDLVLNLEEFEKDGKKYFRSKSHQLTLTPRKITFDLKNLFDGDKLLSDNVLAVMNENWSDLFKDVEPHYEEAYGKIFENAFNSLFAKVPIDEAFGTK